VDIISGFLSAAAKQSSCLSQPAFPSSLTVTSTIIVNLVLALASNLRESRKNHRMNVMTTHRPQRQAASPPELHGLVVFETSLGWVAASWHQGCLQRLVFGYPDPQQAMDALQPNGEHPVAPTLKNQPARSFSDRLRSYAEGEPADFSDIPVLLAASTPFQSRVLECCHRIPYGQTRTYAQLAATAGSPGACRAVGNIMAQNRIPLIIPCHRVVGSGGALGGYSAPGGLSTKRRLLRLEGAEVMQ
jgi:methylated-DNA-[protein]-cysteine S-methyltransferase